MKQITTAQIKKIHALLCKMNLLDKKEDMIYGITRGRTIHSREMTAGEGIEFIKYLLQIDPDAASDNRMRRKVFALGYEAGIIYGQTPDDKKINAAKINLFLRKRGVIKKDLNQLSHNELVKVVTQFEMMLKHINEAEAKKISNDLLAELNLTTN